ncbi:hypothetical protein GCM10017784_23300 [Deinococcus indicus]|nr:hypothetical protein GCM10017784_23300 [Deinococcus indicus]
MGLPGPLQNGQVKGDARQAPPELPAGRSGGSQGTGQSVGLSLAEQLGLTVEGVLVAFVEHGGTSLGV